MTGILVLKDGRFKQRHNIERPLVEAGKYGIITASQEKLLIPPKEQKRTKRRKSATQVQPKPKRVQKPKSYKIDKSEITNRIRGYINQMSGEKMLYFWTVTFPPGTTDDICYILFNKWLTRLRQEKMLRDYLWIAERQDGKRITTPGQQATHTLHFHIAVNKKMCVKKANRFMRASIMHCINNSEILYSRDKAKNYNGVDIAKDRKTRRVINFAKKNKGKSLSNYLTKYVTKNETTFQHLAWHSSRGYSNLITKLRFTSMEISQSNIMSLVDQEKILDSQYFTFYRWKTEPPKEFLQYLAEINQHIQSLLN